ncbi:MAG: ferredoxin, partial [Burkholderiales bacterium]
AATPGAAEGEPEKPSDDAYIETPRCTTCNECTNLNNRMFAYDANKQAYLADVNAGTYRELVEAAESCQVSIIHPGKPRNPNEPGVAELLKRAEPFL